MGAAEAAECPAEAEVAVVSPVVPAVAAVVHLLDAAVVLLTDIPRAAVPWARVSLWAEVCPGEWGVCLWAECL